MPAVGVNVLVSLLVCLFVCLLACLFLVCVCSVHCWHMHQRSHCVLPGADTLRNTETWVTLCVARGSPLHKSIECLSYLHTLLLTRIECLSYWRILLSKRVKCPSYFAYYCLNVSNASATVHICAGNAWMPQLLCILLSKRVECRSYFAYFSLKVLNALANLHILDSNARMAELLPCPAPDIVACFSYFLYFSYKGLHLWAWGLVWPEVPEASPSCQWQGTALEGGTRGTRLN